MNTQTQEPQQNDLIVSNPKNPNSTRFSSKFPIGGRSVLAFFAAKSMQKKRLLRKTKPIGSPVYS
jgi:hypothetical protein